MYGFKYVAVLYAYTQAPALGLAGQLCWNVENQWFNTFVYAKIGPYPWILSWMTAVSAFK